MADEQPEDRSSGDQNNDNGAESSKKGLQNFITEQYEQQKAAGGMEPTGELDDERMNNFFNRALAESQRMSREVDKSQGKLQALKAEFGEEMISAWRNEHAAQVLSPSQQAALQQAEGGAFS